MTLRSAVRLNLAITLGGILFVSIMGSSSSRASGTARDYPDCINSCNSAREACVDQCPINCADMFPTDSSQAKACVQACNATCVDKGQECKARCRAIKNGECPPDP
ncbi:MAG TPA: hypothetical protein VFG76_09515 [Candidatus Polarisedimenticolia bacterium]|nr:hypothetical protein [Candidatus Polarisedimenticolia bacterium]